MISLLMYHCMYVRSFIGYVYIGISGYIRYGLVLNLVGAVAVTSSRLFLELFGHRQTLGRFVSAPINERTEYGGPTGRKALKGAN